MNFKFIFIWSLFLVLCGNVCAKNLSEKDLYVLFMESKVVQNENEIEVILKKLLAPLGLAVQKKGLFLFKEKSAKGENINFVRLKFSSRDEPENLQGKLHGVIQGYSYSNNLSKKVFFPVEEQETLFSIDLEDAV